jgi:hypothetical protein
MVGIYKKPEMSEFEKGVVHGRSLVKAALLTELRNSGLLEEKEICQHGPTSSCDTDCYNQSEKEGHNTLARAIKAHLDELIKLNSV